MKTIDEQLEEALARITKSESDATASTSLLTEAGHQHERFRQEIAALTKDKETLWLASGELTEQRDQLSRDLTTAKQSLTSAATGAEEFTTAKERITELLSARFASDLRKRLADLEVPTDGLREQWQNRLGAIVTVQSATRIVANYKLGRRIYQVEATSGFDEESGVLWVRQSEGMDAVEAFFEAIANRMFAENAPKYVACVLQRVLHHEVRESPVIRARSATADEPHEGESDDDFLDPDPGETFQTHRQSAPDVSKNLPQPAPLSSAASLRLPRSVGGQGRTPSPSRSMPERELAHREELKRDHYAWHCQRCLAQKQPRRLAPAGSYAELQENRHKFIEAHHPDQVHAISARHGGNLLILCHYHHDSLGDVLTRAEIADALRNRVKPKTITFHAGNCGAGNKQTVAGFITTVRLKGLPRDVRLFFTADHRDLWLQSSANASSASAAAE